MRTKTLCTLTGLLAATLLPAALPSSPASAATRASITVAATPKQPVQGKPAYLYGSVRPASAGRAIRLQIFQGGAWRQVRGGETRISSRSTYKIGISTRLTGLYTYRMVLPPLGGKPTGSSPTIRVRVVAPPKPTPTASPTTPAPTTPAPTTPPPTTPAPTSPAPTTPVPTTPAPTTPPPASSTPSSSPSVTLSPTQSPTPSPTPTAPAVRDRVRAGESLGTGQTLRSPNGRFVLSMQSDGNLVLRDGTTTLFDSGTAGNANAALLLSSTGQLNVQGGGRILWQPDQTAGTGGQLVLLDDGRLLLQDAAGTTVWDRTRELPTLRSGATMNPGDRLETSTGSFILTMQPDGNLVLRAKDGTATWQSFTSGFPNAVLVAQTDGNVVLRQPGRAVCDFGTAGRGDVVLRLRDDGVLAVNVPGGVAWNSGSGTCTKR